MQARQRGFTLLELLITVALVAIVLAIGIPSFRDMMRENRLTAYANEFLGALAFTRSEAIKRGQRVVLCKSSNGSQCTADSGYAQGWIVFVAQPNATKAEINSNADILRVYGALPVGMTFVGNNPVKSYVSYNSDGLSRSFGGGFQAGTLTLCHENKGREVIINSTGRARIAKKNPC